MKLITTWSMLVYAVYGMKATLTNLTTNFPLHTIDMAKDPNDRFSEVSKVFSS